jgi:hypothetical protein
VATAAPRSCRINRCVEEVPPALAAESLCLDHFLDQSFTRADLALEKCQRGESIDRATLDWLLADAQLTLSALSELAAKHDLAQQSRILELLLCVANLNEYIAHHSVQFPAQA